MIFDYKNEDRLLSVKLTEEIDQHSTEKIRRELDEEIEKYVPRHVVLDFSSVSFMDSSGIGMVLGRFKLVKLLGGNLEIVNVNKSVKRIFDMSGVSRIIAVQEINNNVYKKFDIDNVFTKEGNNEGVV